MIGCGEDRSSDKELTKIEVGITKSFIGEAAFFTAQEHNFFRDAGLDVVTHANTSGKNSLQDLLQKKVDIAHVAETPIVFARLDTISFRIFAEMIYATEVQHIISRKDRGILSPADLLHKKVGVYKGTQLDYFLDSFILEHNLDPEQILAVNLAPAEQVKAISEGRIDAAAVWEPYATYIMEKLGENGHMLDTRLTYSTLWLATVRKLYAQQHPMVLTKYLQALHKAQKYMADHPVQTQKLLARETGVTLNAIKKNWDDIDYELSLSERMITLFNDQAGWMRRKGWADTTGINFREMIIYEPMENVRPKGITIIR